MMVLVSGLSPPSHFFDDLFLLIWLLWVLVAACGIFSCGTQTLSCSMWDVFPGPGTEPKPPELGVWNLSHSTTREVPPADHSDSGSFLMACTLLSQVGFQRRFWQVGRTHGLVSPLSF